MVQNSLSDIARFAWCYWHRHPGKISILVAGLLAVTACEVLVPLIAGRLVEVVTNKEPVSGADLPAAIGALAWLLGLGAAFQIIRQSCLYVFVRLAAQCMAAIMSETFHRVQRFSADWHATSFAGATVRKLSRGMWAFDTLEDAVYLGILPTTLVLVGIAVALFLHWPLMGTFLSVSMAFYIAATVWMKTRWIAPVNRISNEADSTLGGAVADAITNNGIVKAFAAETREDAALAEAAGDWRTKANRCWNRYVSAQGVQQAMLLFLQAGLLGMVIWFWANGRADTGDVAFVMTAYFMIHGYLRDIGHHLFDLQRSINEIDDIVTFARLPMAVQDRSDARHLNVTQGHIEFDHVHYRYSGQSEPLYDGLSFEVFPGEMVALVGHSGSGKSSLVKLLQRLYDIDGGRITIDGQNIRTVTQESLRRAISVVPQDTTLFHRSLAENIAYGRPRASREDIEWAARQAHADGFIARLPKGYDTPVGERGVKLSGGERQRIAIARAFLADAPILVFDEATSSLDARTEAHVQAAMSTLMAGRTTIVVAHRLSTVRMADRILVFERGRIVEQGNHSSLIVRPDGHYRRLHGLEAPPAMGEAV